MISANSGNSIPTSNLQWGYKVYGSGYKLLTEDPENCTVIDDWAKPPVKAETPAAMISLIPCVVRSVSSQIGKATTNEQINKQRSQSY